MSELKAYIGPHPTDHTLTEYYLKSKADKLIAYHKYKRCLKNREICVMRCDIEFARQYPTRASFWMKWERKWLELAEQFKECV